MGNTDAPTMDALVAEASAALADDSPLVGDSAPAAAETPSAAEAPQDKPQDAPSAPDKPAWTYEDFQARYESDPDFRKAVDKQHIEVRANALFQKERARADRTARKAQLTKAAEDPVEALDLAKTELEQLNAEESQVTRTVNAVQAELERIAADEDDGAYYAALYQREGKAKLDALLGEDAQAGLRWIKKEVRKLAIEAETKKTLPTLAEAMADHKNNAALAALPVPLTDTAAAGLSDKEFLEAYARGDKDDTARAAKLLGIGL